MERIPSHHLSGARFRMSPRYLWNGNLRPCSGRKILRVDFLKHKIFSCLWSSSLGRLVFFLSLRLETIWIFLIGTCCKVWRKLGDWLGPEVIRPNLFLQKIEESCLKRIRNTVVDTLLFGRVGGIPGQIWGQRQTRSSRIPRDEMAHHPLPHVTWHPTPSCVLKEASPPVPEAFDISAMEGLGAR